MGNVGKRIRLHIVSAHVRMDACWSRRLCRIWTYTAVGMDDKTVGKRRSGHRGRDDVFTRGFGGQRSRTRIATSLNLRLGPIPRCEESAGLASATRPVLVRFLHARPITGFSHVFPGSAIRPHSNAVYSTGSSAWKIFGKRCGTRRLRCLSDRQTCRRFAKCRPTTVGHATDR